MALTDVAVRTAKPRQKPYKLFDGQTWSLDPHDPAFAYEIAVIVADGLRRMYADGEDIFYYLSLYNENHAMPPMPEGAAEGILKGLYRFKAGLGKQGLKAGAAGTEYQHPPAFERDIEFFLDGRRDSVAVRIEPA